MRSSGYPACRATPSFCTGAKSAHNTHRANEEFRVCLCRLCCSAERGRGARLLRASRREIAERESAAGTSWASMASESTHKKVIVIGDGCVGKTCFVSKVTENKFIPNYLPTLGGEPEQLFVMRDARRAGVCL